MPKVNDAYIKRRREKIVLSSKKVFEENGFNNVCMEDLIVAANVSRATIYNYFENVEAIFLSVLDYVDINVPEIIEGMSFIEQLENWIRSTISPQLSSNTLVRARSEYFLQNTDNNFYLNRYSEIKGYLLLMFDKSGECTDVNKDAMCGYIISFINGLMMDASQMKTFNSEEQISFFLKSLKTYIDNTNSLGGEF